MSAPPPFPRLRCHGDDDVIKEAGPGVHRLLRQLRLGDAIAAATALRPRLLSGMSEEAGHSHQRTGE